jgi:hypothetical protein
MSYKLTDIKHETRNFFVIEVGDRGFEVCEVDYCHTAKRVAQIGHGESPYLGLDRAIKECDRRQELRTAKDLETLRLAKLFKQV